MSPIPQISKNVDNVTWNENYLNKSIVDNCDKCPKYNSYSLESDSFDELVFEQNNTCKISIQNVTDYSKPAKDSKAEGFICQKRNIRVEKNRVSESFENHNFTERNHKISIADELTEDITPNDNVQQLSISPCVDDSDKDPTYSPDPSEDDSFDEIVSEQNNARKNFWYDEEIVSKKNIKPTAEKNLIHGLKATENHNFIDIIHKDSMAELIEDQMHLNIANEKSPNDNSPQKNETGSYDIEANTSKSYKRKKDFCYFCETEILNFVRHIKRNHPCETEVAKIFVLPAKSNERRNLLAILRKKGNYLKNAHECFKPVKQAVLPDRKFLPCTKCLGFYSSKFLYRHRKKCLGHGSKNSQSEGQDLLLGNVKVNERLKQEVFPRMRPDKISLVAKQDFLICAFGARYLLTHREKHFINVTSRKMRELSIMLIEVKKVEPSICNMFEALQPKYYDLLVEATKSVAKYDTDKDLFLAPTFAMNISTSLKQCCDIAIHMVIKKEATVQSAKYEASLKTMINLMTSNWRFDISSRAGNDLNIQKFNKITIVPLASDIKLLKQHLITKSNEATDEMLQNPNNIDAYNTLLETIFCRVILLNRRRPGELQRMLLYTYENAAVNKNSYEEFSEAITETEKMLLKRFKRVVIRGKRGRGVPVIFDTDTQHCIEQLLKVRPNFLGSENPYLFGKPNFTTPIYGYKVLAKYAVASGTKNPEAITCTRLRKHLATLTQLFDLSQNEIEQLATFMGHTPGVHMNSYRLPDDVYQTAKISKLLLLMERGKAGKYKGKALNDIDINLEENLLSDSDADNEIDDDKNNDEEINKNPLSFINNKKQEISNSGNNNEEAGPSQTTKKKRNLVPWTTEQKKVVMEYFKNHIEKSKPPKKRECELLLSQYPDILFNKSWLKIKVFIQNIYTSKKKGM